MTVEQQSAILRAMRAWSAIEQQYAATGAGTSQRTLIDAEKGRTCSEKTWATMLAYYASLGLHWRAGDGVEPDRILIIAKDQQP